jgi:hypothetical protein
MQRMTEEPTSGEADASICPWCSATYRGEPETCPSCGAVLAVDPASDPSLPGLTAIDTDAIARAKTPTAKPRNRILSWISGDYPEEGAAAAGPGALAPPDLAVRREILRLELEAEVANLQAEADALLAEVTVESHTPGASARDVAAATSVVNRIGELSHELEAVDAELGGTHAGTHSAAAQVAASEGSAPAVIADPVTADSVTADEAPPPA